MKAIKYKIKKLTDKIVAIEVPDDWDRAMLFLRAQEYYESGSPLFKGKDFDIWDYIKWYSKNMNQSGDFSYPNDWVGFNLPVKVIANCLDGQKTTKTPYDEFMEELLYILINRYDVSEDEGYVIGVKKFKGREFLHEISHALWYTNSEYQKRAKELIKIVPDFAIESMTNRLKAMGYAKSVIPDEITAHCSTGDMLFILSCNNATLAKEIYAPRFEKLFKEYLPKSIKI